MANTNKALHNATAAKEDEFYTLLPYIEKELKHYKAHFEGKTIFCNCDDPEESNFWKFFYLNFNALKLKKLLSTHYDPEKPTYKLEFDGKEIIKTDLRQNGDFRSPECIEIQKTADIVVTNPPFSMWREYVQHLMTYDSKFIIIGSQNALTYKEIFPYLMNNQLWTGYNCGDMAFRVPDYFEPRKTRYWEEDGVKYRSMGNITWFTNLDIEKRHEDLILYKKYSPEEYPKYDNYDAINVNKVAEIPMDYDGLMGVPLTFVNKYNPEQFEIVDGLNRYSVVNPEETKAAGKYLSMINGKALYFRYVIRRKQS